jgi:hypothetical protein
MTRVQVIVAHLFISAWWTVPVMPENYYSSALLIYINTIKIRF